MFQMLTIYFRNHRKILRPLNKVEKMHMGSEKKFVAVHVLPRPTVIGTSFPVLRSVPYIKKKEVCR